MENKNSELKPNIVRYPIANAGRRLGCRILDILMMSLIVFGLGAAILCTSPNFNPKDLTTIQSWRYTLLAAISLLLFFLYFIVLPFFWKKTLWMKVLKLQYVNNLPLSNFMFNLIKHEILVWGIISILSLIAGIVLGTLSSANATAMIKGMTFGGLTEQGDNTAFFYVGTGFSSAYIVALLVMIAVTIAMFVNNRRPAFHDKFSNVFVIYLVSSNTPDKQVNAKKKTTNRINYGVPGEISPGAFEEIDKL